MTVQQLIDKLNELPDKTLEVCYEDSEYPLSACTINAVLQDTELFVSGGKKNVIVLTTAGD